MSSRQLALSIADVNEDEVAAIFSEHFGFAAERIPGVVEYGRQGEPPAIVLRYSRKDRLKAIEGGPGLQQSDLDVLDARLHAELRGPARQTIAREIIFCSVPVTGFYRGPDIQILPAPSGAPRAPVLMALHPFVLEFPVQLSANVWIQASRRRRNLRHLALLLNVVLDATITEQNSDGHHVWALVERDERPIPAPEWCQEGYWFDGMIGQSDHFSRPEDTAAIAIVETERYFERWGYTGEPLEVPAILDTALAAFYALNADARATFLRAAFWYRHASLAARFARSAAFIALISSLEALLPDPPAATNCETCGQNVQPSISTRFIAMLDTLAPGGGQTEVDRRKLYAIRSKLAHGSSLLRSDEDASNYLHPEQSREWNETGFAYRVTRIALMNWLLAQQTRGVVRAAT